MLLTVVDSIFLVDFYSCCVLNCRADYKRKHQFTSNNALVSLVIIVQMPEFELNVKVLNVTVSQTTTEM